MKADGFSYHAANFEGNVLHQEPLNNGFRGSWLNTTAVMTFKTWVNSLARPCRVRDDSVQ